MRIKVDENIGWSGITLLRDSGHDVMTVAEQHMTGAPDEALFDACVAEERVLITLDRDFGQMKRFPRTNSAGIVVLELGGPASIQLLLGRLRGFLAMASTRPVKGELWIVEPGRVRIRRA